MSIYHRLLGYPPFWPWYSYFLLPYINYEIMAKGPTDFIYSLIIVVVCFLPSWWHLSFLQLMTSEGEVDVDHFKTLFSNPNIEINAISSAGNYPVSISKLAVD